MRSIRAALVALCALAPIPAADASAPPPPDEDAVVVVGFGASVELATPTMVAMLGKGASELGGAPTDLVTASMRSGKLANAVVTARVGHAPTVRDPRGSPRDAGLEHVARGPDNDRWQIVTGGLTLPLVDLPFFAMPEMQEALALPIEVVTDVVFRAEDAPYPGAKDAMLTVVGPFGEAPTTAQLTAAGQRLVAKDMTGSPRWIELAYEHEGLAWRQRIYWAVESPVIVRYQVPANRGAEEKLLRAAAERIAREVRATR